MTVGDEYAQIAPFYDLEFDEFDADIDLYIGYAHMVGGPVLELGCGTGRAIAPLAEAGFSVVGVDNSLAMTEIARSRLQPHLDSGAVELVVADMRDLSAVPDQSYRLAFIAINSFLHLQAQEDQILALRQVRERLDRDGLLVIDVFNPSNDVLARMADRYTFDAEWTRNDGSRIQRFSYRHLDTSQQTITTKLFYDEVAPDSALRRSTTEYVMRYIHRFELELLLSIAGFELEGIYGSYSLDPLEQDSEVIIAVAHRTANEGES